MCGSLVCIIIFFYFPSAVFNALMLVGPSKCLKQIILLELNRVKNPNWPDANQLVIYERDRGFELGTTVNKSSQRSERDLNLGPHNIASPALNHSATLLWLTGQDEMNPVF